MISEPTTPFSPTPPPPAPQSPMVPAGAGHAKGARGAKGASGEPAGVVIQSGGGAGSPAASKATPRGTGAAASSGAAGRLHNQAVATPKGAARMGVSADHGKVGAGTRKTVESVRQFLKEYRPEEKQDLFHFAVPVLSDRFQGLANSIERHRDLLQRMFRPRGGIGGAARRRYGDAVASQVNQILNSDMSLEEKFMLICALLADKLENDIEGQMRKWSQALSDGGSKVSNGPGQGAGGSTSAAGGVAGGSENQQSQLRQVETKIQVMMQRLNRLMSMVSNCLASNHKAKMASIQNIRA